MEVCSATSTYFSRDIFHTLAEFLPQCWDIKNCSQTSKEVFALLVCLFWHSKSQEYSIFQMTSVSHPFFESSQVCLKLRSVPLSLYRPDLTLCLQIWAHWRMWVWKVNKYTQFWKHLTCLFKLGCKLATTKQWKMQIQSVETLKTWLVDVCFVLFWMVFSSRSSIKTLAQSSCFAEGANKHTVHRFLCVSCWKPMFSPGWRSRLAVPIMNILQEWMPFL